MSGPCRYADVFGAPGTGAHRYRLGGLAAVDLLATGGLAYLAARLARRRVTAASYALALLVLLVVAVAAHEAFCVNTRLTAALFGRAWPGPHPAAEKGPHPAAEKGSRRDPARGVQAGALRCCSGARRSRR
jgi:hypothetical protein